MNSALAARALLVDALRYDLIGPMREDEILEQRPTRWYLAGFLVPRGTAAEQITDPTDDEGDAVGLPSDADDDQGDPATPAARAWFPSSFGLSVLLDGETSRLRATLSWGEYRKLPPLESSAAWQRHRPAVWASRFAPEEGAAAPAPATAPASDAAPSNREAPASATTRRRSAPPPLWQRTPHRAALDLPVTRSATHRVPGYPGLSLRVEVRDALSPGLPIGARTASIFLVNERSPGEQDLADQQAIYQVGMELGCDAGFLSRTSIHQQDATDFDEQRVDLQYRDHGEWAVGHNVSSEATLTGQRCHHVRTAWLPRGTVWRMRAREIPGVPVVMADLAAVSDPAVLRGGLLPLIEAYTAWIADQRARHESLSGSRREVAEALARAAEGAVQRIEDGLDWLSAHPDAMEAFRLTNEAMDLAARHARPELYQGERRPAWRLFQLAFLLLNVRGIADPSHPDRGFVELLFFPTGGGKTEAYLGVAAFAMILRRLRHASAPHEGAGISILLRYTLRMLTLDQLGRAATLICALESLRVTRPRLGARRFQVGLWVGRSATPTHIEEAEKQLAAWKANPQDRRRAPPMPLHECPWCRTPFNAGSYAVRAEGGHRALRVGCVNADCDFHFDATDNLGVPVVVIDEQIYRELPTFLLATVDKFAGLPRIALSGTLFGRVKAKDAHGFYTDLNAPTAATRFPGGLLPPDVILQDELHLITGPLGTMVGLYETVLGELCREPGGARPKLIASTATARGAQRQVQALYGAKVVETFPPPGLDPADTFFAQDDVREESSRLYVGVAAPGRNVKSIAVRVYSALLSAAHREWERAGKKSGNQIDTYMTLLCYFNTLRELGGAQRLVQEEVSPRCARLHERCAFQDSQSALFSRRFLAFDPLELTSRQSTDQIRQATAQLKAPYGSEIGKKNDVLLASSMISVGVDIPRLGLMVMNGQPKTVAEYIQATSRVGRETPGLVVTLLNLRRPRDRSHYERFSAFHEGFYRMVEASSVTPFSARALDRGLAGVVVALARHLYSDLNGPKRAQELDRIADLPARLQSILRQRVRHHRDDLPARLEEEVVSKVRGLLNDWSQIAASLRREQIPLVYSPWEIKGGVPLLTTALDPIPDKDPRLKQFRAPTSMRDVEATVHIWAVNSLGGEEQP